MRLTSNLAVRAVMAVALGGVARHAAAPSYTVTDLGTLPAFTSSQADGVNATGQVAGVSADPLRIEHGFNWTSGTLQDIGTLPTFDSSAAIGINTAGQMSGEVYNSAGGPSHAVTWTATAGLVDIHDNTLGFSSTEAAGTMTSTGQIAGKAIGAVDGLQHPFLWTNGVGMADLGPMPGMTEGFASGASDAGVVGTSWNLTDGRAFLWANGAFTDLGTLPGFRYAWATAINATGQVVGTVSNDAGPIDAFSWTQATGMSDLGPLPGYLFVHPYAVNGQGVVVGEASNSANNRVAFVWQNGIMTDLNTLIPATSGWVLQIATGINDNGQIVGTGTIGGQVHGFLLTTTP